MEQKIKYQYTYFIKPFVIKEEFYCKYIQKLLKDKKIKLKVFNKEKDIEINNYFEQNIKEIMFPTLSYNKEQIKELEQIEEKMYSKVCNMPCLCFEHELEQNTQGKIGEEDGIFFRIENMQIICFKTGICFIAIKTFIDENATLDKIVDFNNKFQVQQLDIKIQSNDLGETTKLTNFLQELTANNLKDEPFYTFSYMCVDGEEWNVEIDFEKIENEFKKLVNLNSDNESNIEIIKADEYIKIGIGKWSTAIITNSLETYNYTKLPFEYETKYLYTLIYCLYQMEELKQIKTRKYNKKLKHEIHYFINNVWNKEITKEEIGSKLYKAWKQVLELEKKYLETINTYEISYKTERTKKKKRNQIIIWGIIFGCVIVNIINIAILINIGR